jgi:hypothetical protein
MKILNDIACSLNWMEIGVEGIENLLRTSVGEKKILKKHFFISLCLRVNKQNIFWSCPKHYI